MSARTVLLIEKFLMPFVLSIFMTFIISFVSTIQAIGFANITLSGWFAAWLWSWLIAFPTLLIVLPIVKRLIQFLIQQLKQQQSINL